MTERRLSPTAATAQARRATRRRFKCLREDKRPVHRIPVDSPRVFAGRIAALLQEAAYDNPGVWSDAYVEFVMNRFADKYVELCRVAPIPVGAR